MSKILDDCECPVCSNHNVQLWNTISHLEFDLLLCPQCSFVFQPEPTEMFNYDIEYYDFWDLGTHSKEIRQMKLRSAYAYLDMIKERSGINHGRLLDVGCAYGFLLEAARNRGYQAYGVDVSSAIQFAKKKGFDVYETDFMNMSIKDNFFDVITLVDMIEHISRPKDLFRRINRSLKVGGAVFIITPDVFSLSRKMLNNYWFHFKHEHVSYFCPNSLSTLLSETGFELRYIGLGYKHLSYQYIVNHFLKYNRGLVAKGLQFIGKLLPSELALLPIRYPTEMLCIATKSFVHA
ncbi:MAG: class I SAM-dependent methyltransferase [Candidatus Thermoplasmatota archaeon]|nr:class I SAM-dependent methyltransferase [Candidatus Thermoplasmatota archaeon]